MTTLHLFSRPLSAQESAQRTAVVVALLLATSVVIGAALGGWTGAALVVALAGAAGITWLGLYTESGIGG